jgi:toluene monooxygenase system protein E
MADTNAPKKLRTWSAFGDMRRKPSDYEIVTHGLNYTMRANKKAPLESNPTSPINTWISTYRDKSPLQCDDWDGFRDPAQLTYRKYVEIQSKAEQVVTGVLEEYEEIGHDSKLSEKWLRYLAHALTPQRFPTHALQMIESYLASMAPSSYIVNAGTFAAGDLLRCNSLLAYRTKQLQRTNPNLGFGTNERTIWEKDPAWQPIRKVLEQALVAYDWGECLAAVNLVLKPSLNEVLNHQLSLIAKDSNDSLTWMILGNIQHDTDRNVKWSVALARYAIDQRKENQTALQKWVNHWLPRAKAATEAAAKIVATAPNSPRSADAIVAAANEKRASILTQAGLSAT